MLEPVNILVRQKFSFEGACGLEERIAPQQISFSDIRTRLPGQPIWTMTPDWPREL